MMLPADLSPAATPIAAKAKEMMKKKKIHQEAEREEEDVGSKRSKKKQKLHRPAPPDAEFVADDGISKKKKKKKEMKKRGSHQEEDDKKKEHKSAAAPEAEFAEPDGNHDDKKINKKKKKKKNNKRNNEKQRGGGGDGDVNQTVLITDERFASAQWDPRFQRMPKRESKITIDSRFAQMLHDESFLGSTAPVDKRGRPRRGKAVNPLLHYYLQEEEPAEEDGKSKMRTGEKDWDEEEAVAEASDDDEEMLSVPGSDADVSSSSEDDDDDDDVDQCSVNSDIAHILMANHEDTPTIEHETHRLAIVNMDWDHIKAVDLFVVMNSCLPDGGQILSVGIYPTGFGLKCMEEEAVRGPSALFNGSNQNSEDGSETDDEELRTYELNKLRYYYAVVVCDSSATANHVYKTLDGTEFLTTSNVFDLRFIADSMEFKNPHDITTEVPTSYKEPNFHTRALQHSKVKLTWDEDEPHRTKILRRKFNPNQLDEFNEYLASTEESESDDDENDRGSKKRIGREEFLSLLQHEDDSDADHHSDGNDMEITFSTGLENLSKRILEKKNKKSETVWEAVLRKKSEKKKARKNRSNYHSSEDDSSDSDVQEAPDQPDDFFVEEEPAGADAKTSSTKSNDKSKKRGKGSRNERDQSPEINKEQEASRAELELLLAEGQDAENRPKGYNLKHKKVKGKKGKDMPAEDKLPELDYKNDPRFSALLTSHLFALDPTDPQFKRSATYARQRPQNRETSATEKATEEKARNPSEMQSDEDLQHPVGVPSSEKEKYNFSSTIRSLKRNLGTMKKEKKRI